MANQTNIQEDVVIWGKQFITRMEVRGYELDSFGHVNNAVYLNYLEQARWELVKEVGLLAEMKEKSLFAVVTSLTIKYIRELKLFDNIEIISKFTVARAPFLTFKHEILIAGFGKKACTAKVDLLLIDDQKIAHDCPNDILKRLMGS